MYIFVWCDLLGMFICNAWVLYCLRPPYTNGNVNLGLAYAVSYMDSQVSNYWLYQKDGNDKAAEKCRQNATAMSMDSSIPCVFTRAVAYETSDSPDKNVGDERKHKNKGFSFCKIFC